MTSAHPHPVRSAPLLSHRRRRSGQGPSSLGRTLAVLDAFTLAAPRWTVDGLTAALGFARSTTYRYVKELCEAGLLAPAGGGGYVLGPRIIELDRLIRRCDPLLAASRDVMRGMLADCGNDVLLLCRLYRDKVLCVHQERAGAAVDISYSRGRPMPLFRGATSKIMLAYLPERQAARLFLEHRQEIAAAGLGEEWREFSALLRALRRRGFCVSHGEVDKGAVGVAAPIFDPDRRLLGSLSRVLAVAEYSEQRLPDIARSVMEGAGRITENLARLLPADGVDAGGRTLAPADAAE